jgi:hypothetical protein
MSYSLYDSIYVSNTGNVGIGTNNPIVSLDLSQTQYPLVLPKGSSNQRSSVPNLLRFNTDINNIELYINNTWSNVVLVPTISNVSTNVLKNAKDTIDISGTNFDPSASFTFVDNFGRTFYPKQIMNLTSTSVTLKRPDWFPPEYAPYTIKVQQFGRYNTYGSITAGVIPSVNVAAGSLGTFESSTTITPIVITGTDESGGGIFKMDISTGTLPGGLTGTFTTSGITGTYTISGTTGSVGSTTTYPFGLRVIDNGYNQMIQNYSITINGDVPTTIANLQLFLDADSYSSGTTWTDRSANGYNFTVNSTAYATINGIQHFNFEGSYGAAKRIVNSTLTNVPAFAAATIIVFSTILNSTTNPRTLIRGLSADHQILVQGGSNILGMYDNNVTGYILTTFDVSTIPNYTTKFNMLVVKLATSSPYYQFKYNNINTWYTITNANATFNNGFCVIGSHHDATAGMGTANFSQFWGKIAKFMYYSRHLTDSEITSIYRSYQSKYNLYDEYPPIGIGNGDTWTKDAADTILGINNVTYRKYKYTVSGAGYGNGQYVAWSNDILSYNDSTSTYNSDEWPPSGPFDKRVGSSSLKSGWHSTGSFSYSSTADATTPAYLAIKLPDVIVLKQYSIQSRDGCCTDQVPSKWDLQGSSDKGTTWTTIDSRSGVTTWSLVETKTFDVTNTTAYQTYRILVYRSSGSNYIHIGELKLYGLYVTTILEYPVNPWAVLNAVDISQSNNTTVASWGTVRTFSQSTEINKPIYFSTGGYNNGPYVFFNRTNTTFLNAGSQTLNISTNGGFTMMALVKFTGNAASWERIFDFGNGSGVDNIFLGRQSNTQNFRFEMFNPSTSTNDTTSNPIVQDVWNVYACRYIKSSKLQVYKNNVLEREITVTTDHVNRTLANTYIGRSNWADEYLNAHMSKLFVYDRALSDSDMTQLYNYIIST